MQYRVGEGGLSLSLFLSYMENIQTSSDFQSNANDMSVRFFFLVRTSCCNIIVDLQTYFQRDRYLLTFYNII